MLEGSFGQTGNHILQEIAEFMKNPELANKFDLYFVQFTHEIEDGLDPQFSMYERVYVPKELNEDQTNLFLDDYVRNLGMITGGQIHQELILKIMGNPVRHMNFDDPEEKEEYNKLWEEHHDEITDSFKVGPNFTHEPSMYGVRQNGKFELHKKE
jgi:hypothetical protein